MDSSFSQREASRSRPPNRAQTLRTIEDQLAADKEALENAQRKYEATLATWQAHPVTVKRQRREHKAQERRERKQRARQTREAIEDQVTELWSRFEKTLGTPPDANKSAAEDWLLNKAQRTMSTPISFSAFYQDIVFDMGFSVQVASYCGPSGRPVTVEVEPFGEVKVPDHWTGAEIHRIRASSWEKALETYGKDKDLQMALFLVRYSKDVWPKATDDDDVDD